WAVAPPAGLPRARPLLTRLGRAGREFRPRAVARVGRGEGGSAARARGQVVARRRHAAERPPASARLSHRSLGGAAGARVRPGYAGGGAPGSRRGPFAFS